MKAKTFVILCLALVLALLGISAAGCSSTGTDTDTATGNITTATAAAAALPADAVPWNQAAGSIGKDAAVFGPIIDSMADSDSVILGMGKSVTESGGVHILITSTDQNKFPESLYAGQTILVTNTVTTDEAGNVLLIITDPSQVEILP